MANEIVEGVTDKIDVEENDVRYNLKWLGETRYVEHKPARGGNGIVKLFASGVERYENLSGEEAISTGLCTSILEALDEKDRESPRQPDLSHEELFDRIDASEEKIDIAVWYSLPATTVRRIRDIVDLPQFPQG